MVQADKLKVLISYSRDDIAFADQLDAALNLTGFECTIDRHGIRGGEDWKRRLGDLILSSDTIVFVLSPASSVSEICAWEVEEAAHHGKRILPVVCRPLGTTVPPARLRNLNYIHFYEEPKVPGSGFGVGLTALVTALNTDLAWLQEHTRLLERSTEWTAGGQQETALLFGSSIADAKAWIDRRPKGAPEVLPAHIEFIRASEAAEARRQDAEHQRLAAVAAAQDERAQAIADREKAQKREIETSRKVVRLTLAGLGAVSVLALLLAWVGFYAFQKRGEAEQQTQAAQSNLARAAQTSSVFRAEQAKIALERNDPVTAAMVALNGIPDLSATDDFERTRPFYPEAFVALHQAWVELKESGALTKHTSVIRAVVTSSDGRLIVTVSDDNTARLWNAQGQGLRTLAGHESPLTSVAISADGSVVVVGSLDGTATVWDGEGKFIARLSGHQAAITSVAVSADGALLLTTSRDTTARVFDRQGGFVTALSGHTDVVTTGTFSPDGTRVVTGASDHTAIVWDARAGLLQARLTGHTDGVVKAVVLPDGSAIATASLDGTVRVWGFDGTSRSTLVGHTGAITALAAAPDSKSLISGGSDKTARHWYFEKAASVVLKGHAGPISAVAVSADGTKFLTASDEGGDPVTRLWDHTGSQLAVLAGSPAGVTDARFIDGSTVVTVSRDGTGRIWQLSGRQLASLSEQDKVEDAPVALSGGWLLRHEKTVSIYNGDGQRRKILTSSSNASDVVAYGASANGDRIFAAWDDGEVGLYDRSGEVITRLAANDARPDAVALSADGTRMAIFSAEAGRVVDDKGHVLATLPMPGSQIETARFTAEGGIVAATDTGMIQIWSKAGAPQARIDADGETAAVTLSPSGRFAVRVPKIKGSASEDESAVIDLSAGREGPAGRIISKLGLRATGIAFSDHDQWLAFVPENQRARLFDLTTAKFAPFETEPVKEFVGFSPDGQNILAITAKNQVAQLRLDGRTILSVSEEVGIRAAAFAKDDDRFVTISRTGHAKLWRAFRAPQSLVDQVKKDLPRCLDGDTARSLYLKGDTPAWCSAKHAAGDAVVPMSFATVAPVGGDVRGPDLNFAYYPPGDLDQADRGRGRTGDRKVYLPDIVFPLKLGPADHAHMNSIIWGYGGVGWNGKGAKGGSECDPRNYDAMRQRDTFCEVRGWDMPFCPSGVGKQGQSIRPPTCADNKWEVVAVVDGVITQVTSNTTVRLKGADATEYLYLHMHPDSIKVQQGAAVKRGDVIGRVSNFQGGQGRQTALQLNFQVSKVVKIDEKTVKTFVPVYTSLIAAYRRAKGLDAGIDADGTLRIDPAYEIGAGKIPRPPD